MATDILRALLLIAAIATPAAAQGITGVVRDSVTHLPIVGAVLTLLDISGAATTRTLTGERGEYRFAQTGAAHGIHVVRIGYEPRDVRIPLNDTGNIQIDFAMLALPTMLRASRIIATAHCPVRKDRATALGLWEQARAGLLATVVARDENPALLHRFLFDRIMDGASERVASMSVRADSANGTAVSFGAAHSAEDLVRYGFATGLTNTATYFAPDADVLLSKYFAGGYCFDLTDGGRARPTQVGLHFMPADVRRGRTDIDGTLWVDTAARELRDVEFRYLGMPRPAEKLNPGGVVSFRAMPNGVVLVDRWSLRLVNASVDTVSQLDTRTGGFDAAEHDSLYAEETGGELAQATWRDGVAWKASLGAVRLHAVTATGAPAVGSIVALVATPYFGVADSTGNVQIGDLLPGPYIVRVVDPRIAPLRIGLPTKLKFVARRDSTTVASLRVPTLHEFIADRCVAAHEWTVGDSVFVLGRVVTPGGTPVADASVRFSSGGTLSPDSYTTGTDGIFQSCRPWRMHDDVDVIVRRAGMAAPITKVRFDSSIVVVRVVARPAP